MNYIELINKFWLTSEAHSFRTTDIALFFYLLKINNVCSWRESFKRKNIQIQADLDISFNTLKDSRNRLKQAELLDFKSKSGSGDVVYTLSNFDKVRDEVADKVKRTSSKNDEVTNEVAHEVTTEVATEVAPYNTNGTCNQTKLNQTKPITQYAGEEKFPPEVFEKNLGDCRNELTSDQIWWESVCMNNHITIEQFTTKIQEFFRKLQNEGETSKSVKDAKSHFARWLAIDLQKKQPSRFGIKKTGKIESVQNSVEEALKIMGNGQI